MGIGEASRMRQRRRRRDRRAARRSPASAPNLRRARKSIAAFKLREGMPVGVAVTLRKARMWEFARPPRLDRDPADPRLPRAQPALLRRSRQLLARHSRAADLPRDRLRLGQRDPRSRHHLRNHRDDRRGGLRAAARARLPVRAGGAPRRQAASRRSRRRRRSTARRRRACGPRPSRPPSSSSRKRTPRLTRSRRPSEDAEGEGAEAEDPARTMEAKRSRWQRPHNA